MQKQHGVIVELIEDRKFGKILTQEAIICPFLYSDFQDFRSRTKPEKLLPVSFNLAAHPDSWRREAGLSVCKEVRPAQLELLPGTIEEVSPNEYLDGTIRLTDGRNVAYRESILREPLQKGQAVRSMSVPRSRGGLFAIAIERANLSANSRRDASPRAVIAAATRKGNRPFKSVNEDAFLATTLAQGELWLLAVADGVSSVANSWWASNKCMELLWRSRERYERDFLDRAARNQTEPIREWINQVHFDFLQERTRADRDFENSTATLTFVVVRGYEFIWVQCGDSRLYTVTGGKADAVVKSKEVDKKHKLGSRLRNHIALEESEWRNDQGILKGVGRVVPGSLLLLCSDGVVTTSDPEKVPVATKFSQIGGLSKFNPVTQPPQELQEMVRRVLDNIAGIGEQDDLTMIAFRPLRD